VLGDGLLPTVPFTELLLASTPAAEPLLVTTALPRDDVSDAYEDEDAVFELR